MAMILDANAAIDIVRRTDDGIALEVFVSEEDEVLAPDLFLMECSNALWKYVRADTMPLKEAEQDYRNAVALVDRFVRINDLMPEVLHEAVRLDHPIYDMVYLVLARRMAASLMTLDRRLMDLCEKTGVDSIVPIEGDFL